MSARSTKKRPGGDPPGRVRKMFSLSADTAKLLAAVAAAEGCSQSDLVAEALAARLRGWCLPYRRGGPAEELPPSEAPPAPRLAG